MNKLHPGVRWLFRLRGYSVFIPIFIFTIFFSIGIASEMDNFGVFGFLAPFLIFVPIFIIPFIIIVEIYARMTYNRWLYEFGADGLKLERGIIWKRYSNIPYERVQNVDITRGIIARMCGFSSVNVQTAGYSGPRSSGLSVNRIPIGRMHSEGYIPGVNIQEAEKIREFLIKKITKKI